jgi:hypothetical protein
MPFMLVVLPLDVDRGRVHTLHNVAIDRGFLVISVAVAGTALLGTPHEYLGREDGVRGTSKLRLPK